jgi:hypothetical protein
MIPETWTELTLRTSPHFLEDIGFLSTADAKGYLRYQRKTYTERFQLKRQRYCILYYLAANPRADDGKIDMEVEWWGPCSEIISAVNAALSGSHSSLGADDASLTHALLHDRLANRWWLGPFHECQRFVRYQNEELP